MARLLSGLPALAGLGASITLVASAGTVAEGSSATVSAVVHPG